MNLLILTNLYPPQELGGYGRSMADFAWGLRQRGHKIHVLSSDTPHLGPSTDMGTSGETIERNLVLKGSYEGGIRPITERDMIDTINEANADFINRAWERHGPFDGVIAGNIDLLGLEVINELLRKGVTVLHHIGFINPPYHPKEQPKSWDYKLVAASNAVGRSLQQAGLHYKSEKGNSEEIPVVYPGVRADLFGKATTQRRLPEPLDGRNKDKKLGTKRRPLRVCFAGLLMGSKGVHTLVQAVVLLKKQGLIIEGYLAGGTFQKGYREKLEKLLYENGVEGVMFTGQLSRACLARFFSLHHVCVFPSIHPEAFGIVGAEAMASGLTLVSSGVGGASELFIDNESGLKFNPGDANDLANKLKYLCENPKRLCELAEAGQAKAIKKLNVMETTKGLEYIIKKREGRQKSNIIFF